MPVLAAAPHAALLPESLNTEFTIVMTTLLVVLIAVVPVVVMIKDVRRGEKAPDALRREEDGAPRT
ncbi:MAG: hypothetical protein U0Q15_01305 [Kineosporiaceae bacterium]